MSFLAPLYALAALAIGLPILFHLVRKRPKEKQFFSSLMFLEAAPPLLSQQSRIDQWLLLLLRAAALLLLAAAFTRPYWNAASETEASKIGARRLFLIDTSASMKRTGVFAKAVERTESLIKQSNITDAIAVYAFDQTLRTLVSIDEAMSSPPAQRQQLALASLKTAQPTWMGTDLGQAIIHAADLLQVNHESAADSAEAINEIVVVTDFQNGTVMDKLAGYNWPSSCRVRLEKVEVGQTGNAFASLLTSDDEGAVSDSEGDKKANKSASLSSERTRVRVVNEAGSTKTDLQVAWADAMGKPVAGTEVKCKVPSGESLIVRIPAQPQEAVGILLTGDSTDFDNRQFNAATETLKTELQCIDEIASSKEESISYFVEQLPLDSANRTVSFSARTPGSEASWPTPSQTPLMIASHHADKGDLLHLETYLQAGGHVLWVWDSSGNGVDGNAAGRMQSYEQGLVQLSGATGVKVSEAAVKNYAMWEQIDFKHPLFADLADSRFNDFTKVRFWSHRKLELADISQWTVLASFDDGDPALVTKECGAGRLWVMLAGWQPSQSQLALSSKFVPIVSGIFRIAAQVPREVEKHTVGTSINWSQGERILDPAGKQLEPIGKSDTSDPSQQTIEKYESVLEQPGIYQRIKPDNTASKIAVNLPPSESLLAIADVERLERLGVAMSDERPAATKASLQRQMKAVELEAKQGWWRWLVVGVLCVVGIESIVCFVRKRFA